MGTISPSSKDCASIAEEVLVPAGIARRLLELDGEEAHRSFIERHRYRFDDALLAYLKEEADRYSMVDPHASLRLADALVAAGEVAASPGGQALGLLARGNALGCLGRYREAVAALDEAGEAFLARGDEVGWARTRLWWVVASHRLGVANAALPVAGRARAILLRHGERLRAATLDSNTAWVCSELGRYEQALALYQRAQEGYESLGAAAAAQVAWVKTNTGILLTYLGDFQIALRLHEEARQVYLRRGDTVMALRQEQNIAFVHAGQGYYTRALRGYGTAYEGFERANLPVDAAWVALNMVECQLSLNRNAEALDLTEETVERFERHGTPTEAAKARFYAALARARQGDHERALQLLDEAARVFAGAGLVGHLALTTLQRATLHLDDGRWGTALEEAGDAAALFVAHGQPIRRAQADLVRARAALALGDGDLAAQLAGATLGISRDRDVRWLAPDAHHVLGRVAQQRGRHWEALDNYEAAVTRIEQVQRSLAIELCCDFLADKLSIYQDAIDTSLRLAQPRLAFAYLERAKSRTLVDFLANNLDVGIRGRRAGDRALLDELARLREEHNWLYNRRYGYGLADRAEPTGVANEDELRGALRDLERRSARILERLALERTEGLDIAIRPGDSEEFQPPDLPAGTVLLEYYFRADGGAVFVASAGELAVVPLVARPGEIRTLLDRWHLNLETTAQAYLREAVPSGLHRNARSLLEALHRALLTPIEPHLRECERLIVVPYGATHTVPFHALHDGVRHLVERVEVVYAPSCRLRRLCTERPRRQGRSTLLIAYTDGGRLPAALEEAQAIATLLPAETYLEHNATRAAFTAAAPRHSVLHLATHGAARLDNPAFAHLKLADGQLTPADILNTDLHGALVVLSACETGRAVAMGGDEVVGLGRSFLHAGATTLVQSLWCVEDGSTARLMGDFYRALSAGRAAGGALREAQLAALGAANGHPLYWAPFQLLGDGGPLVMSA